MLEGHSISALIPAYNEAQRIPGVLDVLCRSQFVDNITVIDDGSKDNTAGEARRFPVNVIQNRTNRGKAAALIEGIRHTRSSDIYIFLDADLIRLQEEHLTALVEPLSCNFHLDMTVGIFKGGRGASDLAQRLCPILNGQRALRGEWVRNLPDFSWARFGVEVFLTRFARDFEAKVAMIPLWGISHYHKEEKYGPIWGFYQRVKMYYEVTRGYLLYESHIKIPDKVCNERREEEKAYARV